MESTYIIFPLNSLSGSSCWHIEVLTRSRTQTHQHLIITNEDAAANVPTEGTDRELGVTSLKSRKDCQLQILLASPLRYQAYNTFATKPTKPTYPHSIRRSPRPRVVNTPIQNHSWWRWTKVPAHSCSSLKPMTSSLPNVVFLEKQET